MLYFLNGGITLMFRGEAKNSSEGKKSNTSRPMEIPITPPRTNNSDSKTQYALASSATHSPPSFQELIDTLQNGYDFDLDGGIIPTTVQLPMEYHPPSTIKLREKITSVSDEIARLNTLIYAKNEDIKEKEKNIKALQQTNADNPPGLSVNQLVSRARRELDEKIKEKEKNIKALDDEIKALAKLEKFEKFNDERLRSQGQVLIYRKKQRSYPKKPKAKSVATTGASTARSDARNITVIYLPGTNFIGPTKNPPEKVLKGIVTGIETLQYRTMHQRLDPTLRTQAILFNTAQNPARGKGMPSDELNNPTPEEDGYEKLC